MTTLTPAQLQALPPEFLAQDRASQLLGTSIALVVVQTLVFAGYVTARIVKGEGIGWVARVLVPASYVNVLGLALLGIIFVEVGGVGRHVEYWLLTDPIRVKRYLQIQTATEFLYMGGIVTPRLVICDFYLKIFRNRAARWITQIVVVALILYFVSGITVILTICQPFRFKWNKTIPGHCSGFMAAYRYISVPGILIDIAILLLPSSTIWRLQASRTKKIGIFIAFLIGSLGIIGSIVRMVEFIVLDLESDPTYLGVTTMTWTIVEPSAYFICGCLPSMFPLLRFVGQKASNMTSARRQSARSREDSDATIWTDMRHTPSSEFKRLSLRLPVQAHSFDDLNEIRRSKFVEHRVDMLESEHSAGSYSVETLKG